MEVMYSIVTNLRIQGPRFFKNLWFYKNFLKNLVTGQLMQQLVHILEVRALSKDTVQFDVIQGPPYIFAPLLMTCHF